RHGRACPGHPRLLFAATKTWMAGTGLATTESYGWPMHSFRRTHLDRAGAGAAVARGVIHVLDVGLRQHVFARRHRAHHIGHREHRLVVAGAIDRGGKAVVAEFGVFRLLAVLDPVH